MKMKSLFTILKSSIKYLLCTAFLTLVVSSLSLAQVNKVTGTVTNAEDNSPMSGINILVKGKTTGAITDENGNFSIFITKDDSVLVFSFIGFSTQEVAVGKKSVLNIKMAPAVLQLGEVVITSLGIKRGKKALTYSAQAVAPEEVTKARDLNVINSLSGKVAGIDIIKSNSGVGSPTRVVLRGNRSIAGNNQPLYVIDGATIDNSGGGVDSEYGGVAYGDGIGNINPEDIESVTVLKGPSATALYGTRASNGAIVITTKRGVVRKGIGVEYSLDYSVETPVILTRLQNVYGQGNSGIYSKNVGYEWGPVMDGRQVEHWTVDVNSPKYGTTYPFVAHPDNYKDFLRMGTNLTNSFAISAGNKDIQGYFSYTNTQSKGIVPGNDLKRNNFNLRFTANILKHLSLDSKITYFNQDVNNRVGTGTTYHNPMGPILGLPSNISLEEASDFEYYNNDGLLLPTFPQTLGLNPFIGNPYWSVNRILNEDTRNRVLEVSSLKYEIIDGLNVQLRTSLDYIDNQTVSWMYNATSTAGNGEYSTSKSNNYELNNDLLLNYSKNITPGLSINVSVGGNMLTQKYYWIYTDNGGLLKPDLFTVANPIHLTASEDGATKKVNSLYGFATLGFRKYIFLDITARNDWSSTLPPESWSYFYPSAGLTWVISDMVKSRPGWLTFAKVRASLAQVGNDTDPYQLNEVFWFGEGGELGFAGSNATKPASNLKPEITTSKELGMDIRFFQNRIGLDLTWYKSNSKNQLLYVPLPPSSGYYSEFINAGNIQNSGVEATLNLKPLTGDFTWDLALNFAKNKSLVVELSDSLTEYTIRYRGYMTTIKVVEGHEYGDIYTRGFVRNDAGRILIDDDGQPVLTNGQTVAMGNYNPDWIGGIKNSFAWKGFDLSFLIDIRMGGDVFSFTEANLAGCGYSDYTLEGREGMVVDGHVQTIVGNVTYETENTTETTSEEYWQRVGGRGAPVGEVFRYDGSNIRVREAVLGYTKTFKSGIVNSFRASLVGRNLFFIMNKAKIMDPNLMVGNSNYQGVESWGLPGTRSIGVNLKVTF